MTTRTDWTAPYWEAVAAEQLLLAPTLLKRNAEPEPQHLMGAELRHITGGQQAGACLGMLQAAAATVGAAGNPDRAVGVALQQGGR